MNFFKFIKSFFNKEKYDIIIDTKKDEEAILQVLSENGDWMCPLSILKELSNKKIYFIDRPIVEIVLYGLFNRGLIEVRESSHSLAVWDGQKMYRIRRD